ncbi:collagen alpha-1(I) chain-like [Meriones unguiculatus]|uniref:collagen alpha-1(I) chain-like n=1 Tax=Meriones unguiculatus TaxID=10047 RepID=UPI00293F6F7D|nr:collagen alpha-1(I) chain-like [Meriones unguiculatus]
MQGQRSRAAARTAVWSGRRLLRWPPGGSRRTAERRRGPTRGQLRRRKLMKSWPTCSPSRSLPERALRPAARGGQGRRAAAPGSERVGESGARRREDGQGNRGRPGRRVGRRAGRARRGTPSPQPWRGPVTKLPNYRRTPALLTGGAAANQRAAPPCSAGRPGDTRTFPHPGSRRRGRGGARHVPRARGVPLRGGTHTETARDTHVPGKGRPHLARGTERGLERARGGHRGAWPPESLGNASRDRDRGSQPCVRGGGPPDPLGLGCGAAGRAEVVPQPATELAGRAARGSPGPDSPAPPPCTEGSPRSGRTSAAANESARRLREPGRLCPPGIGHAMGSGGRGLGAPRAWLGQACCWVTRRRVSPGNGGGYRSLAGRDGGRARAQAGPADPSNSAAPAPRGAVTFTRAARTLRTPGRPAAPCILAPRGDLGRRSLSGPGPFGGKWPGTHRKAQADSHLAGIPLLHPPEVLGKQVPGSRVCIWASGRVSESVRPAAQSAVAGAATVGQTERSSVWVRIPRCARARSSRGPAPPLGRRESPARGGRGRGGRLQAPTCPRPRAGPRRHAGAGRGSQRGAGRGGAGRGGRRVRGPGDLPGGRSRGSEPHASGTPGRRRGLRRPGRTLIPTRTPTRQQQRRRQQTPRSERRRREPLGGRALRKAAARRPVPSLLRPPGREGSLEEVRGARAERVVAVRSRNPGPSFFHPRGRGGAGRAGREPVGPGAPGLGAQVPQRSGGFVYKQWGSGSPAPPGGQ